MDADSEADADRDAEADGEADGEADCDTDADGLCDSLADSDALSEIDADSEADAERDADADALVDGEADCDTDADALADGDADGDALWEIDADSLADADRDAEADALADGEVDCDDDSEVLSPPATRMPNNFRLGGRISPESITFDGSASAEISAEERARFHSITSPNEPTPPAVCELSVSLPITAGPPHGLVGVDERPLLLEDNRPLIRSRKLVVASVPSQVATKCRYCVALLCAADARKISGALFVLLSSRKSIFPELPSSLS
jgi:hypothetical protein